MGGSLGRCQLEEYREVCWCASAYLTALCSYHTGSLAFGALILTLVQIARIILEYIDHKLRGDWVVGVGSG